MVAAIEAMIQHIQTPLIYVLHLQKDTKWNHTMYAKDFASTIPTKEDGEKYTNIQGQEASTIWNRKQISENGQEGGKRAASPSQTILAASPQPNNFISMTALPIVSFTKQNMYNMHKETNIVGPQENLFERNLYEGSCYYCNISTNWKPSIKVRLKKKIMYIRFLCFSVF